MTFRITKGDLTIETDSEREAARVLAWLGPPTGWYSVADVAPTPPEPEPQVVLVRSVLLDVLKVLPEFPDGITAKGISGLTGVEQSTVIHRLTRLNKMGLAESMPPPMRWRATDLARRAKLVAS